MRSKKNQVNELCTGAAILKRLDAISTSIADVLPMFHCYAASMHGEMKNEIDVLEAKVRGARKQIDLASLSVKYAEEMK